MKPINQRGLFLLLLMTLSACSIKNYNGPEMPEDQVATIELKRPAMSIVPLFWIFPLNLLTWYAEDWEETSWTDQITVKKTIRLNSRSGPWMRKASFIGIKVTAWRWVIAVRRALRRESC